MEGILMLLNKLKETNRLMSAKQDADLIKRELEEYSKAIDKLKSINNNINNYTISLIKLNQINNSKFKYDDLNRVIIEINTYEKDAENGYLNSDRVHRIDRLVRELEDNLKNQWKEYYLRTTGPLRNTVNSLINISSDLTKINIVTNALNPNKLYWPVDERVESIINNNMIDGKNIINSLGVNKEIEEFLKKISENKATIFDLKPEILDWIKSKSLENKIALTFNN